MTQESAPASAATCSFCGRAGFVGRRIIAGPAVGICEDCIQLCLQILNESDPSVLPTPVC
ncbi:MAG: ClpX C4-type zinc finger protein [Nocardioidaceae bacterium]